MTVSIKIENITPDLAKEYLGQNRENRPLHRQKVVDYTREMANNKWLFTSDTIKFDTTGRLLDGQHRLEACIASGCTFRCAVARGLETETFTALDIGLRRTQGDLLSFAGVDEKASKVASIIKLAFNLLEIEKGILTPRSLGRREIEREVLVNQAKKYEHSLLRSINKVNDGSTARGLLRPTTLFAALHWLFSQHHVREANTFFEELITGEGTSMTAENHPIAALRRLLVNISLRRGRYARSNVNLAPLVIKAWNAYLNGETIAQLKYADNEKWPVIQRRKTNETASKQGKSPKKAS